MSDPTDDTSDETAVSDAELAKLGTTVNTLIEHDDDLHDDARRAAEDKRHEMVDETDRNAPVAGRVKEINDAVRSEIEDTLREAVMDADEMPDQLADDADEYVSEVIAEHADLIITDWAISQHELSTRLENRGCPDPDAAYEREKERQLADGN
jgi:hypothetical protein